MDKTLTIKIQNKRISAGIQRLAFRYGFRWNGNIAKVREISNNQFFMVINFTNGTLDWLPEFREDEIESYIQFDPSYEVDCIHYQPAEIIALKNAFMRYQKEFVSVGEPLPKETPKVKYPTWVKEKGIPIQHQHGILRNIEEI